MVFIAAIGGLLGIAVARSIVAVSDTHRFEKDDRWYGPTCDACDSGLNVVLTSCTEQGHRQRSSNVVVLLVTIALSVAIVFAAPTVWVTPAYLIFTWTMILLTVTDLDTKLIPNRIVGPATAIGAVLLVIGHFIGAGDGSLVNALIGGAAYFGVLFLLAIIVPGGLGFGDVKMSFMIGLFTGYLSLGHVLLAGIGSFFIGGGVSLVLLLTRRKTRKDAIAFGPYMTMAAFVSVFAGTAIIDWYLR